MTNLSEPLPGLFSRSKRLVLDFTRIPSGTPSDENIAVYFQSLLEQGRNPRLPENRQAFNDRLLRRTGLRYLVSSYAEDRKAMLVGSSIAAEGRTHHLGIDIFSENLEPVLAPCDGTIERAGREDEAHGFGNYLILRADDGTMPLLFFGHLSYDLPSTGRVRRGQVIARLGDYADNENGGWARHLHLQLFSELPSEGAGLIGYAKRDDQAKYALYPDPMQYFPDWHL